MNHNQPSKRISSSMSLLSLFTLAMTLLIAVNINASTINVSSVTALQTAINNANAGDVLILANGTYLNNTLSISKSNITVKAATSGGVFLNGTNDITISGNYIVFSGFQFTSGDIGAGTVLRITGSHNVVTQLNFSDYYASKYIQINDGTQYNEITFCNLEKKPAAAAIGCTIQISTSPTVPGYHKIRYCSFQNYYGIGGDNGNEPIRIGLGAERANVSRTIVENCYFNNTGLGDGETVSVKCGENLIRFCTFTNQQNAMLVFRNGDNNVAYGNFFINAGGIRVKEASNIYCYNNYFYNSGIGSTADAVTFTYDNTTYPVVLNNVNFIHNTFVECGNIDLGGTGATNNTWANNIFKKSSGSIFTNANAGTTWAGNIRSGTTGITIATGMTNVDPLLTLNSEGFYGLPSNSPAINAASSSYPSILDLANIDDDPTLISDISGQARVGVKDVGADEYSTATTSNRPLAVTDAGPNYLGGPSIAVSTQPSAASICSGSNTTFTASSTSSLSPTTVQWQRSANSGTTWTNITANIDAATTYSGFTTETLVLTGSSSTINNYQYKAVFTNTIGSVDSNVVALTVITTAVPTGLATKTICGAATVASLTGYTGTALQWYSALTGGSALDTTTALTTGNYYVSQTLNGCESTRKTVAVTVTSPAPTASSLLLCTGSTVSDLTATGTSLKWYAAASGGSQLASSTVLSTTTYYVSQTVSTCESSRTAVSVVIYTPASMPILNADGPGNTYELITSVLAPCQGVAAVEAPDMIDGTVIGTHPAFGRHIAEVMDADLGKYVFEFYSHLAEDNDITGGLDRQRVEIKTYGGSTDNLKGTLGETVTYKWRFKVPTGFQPSNNFTHIHQIKAVDGDDSSPLFTLTPRYGTPNTLQLIYTQDATTSTDTKAEVNLSLFENTWVEAVETIKIGTGTAGTYAITIKKVSDGTTILSYSSNAIQTIRTSATDPATTGKVDNSFIRPKWGIYRSLLDSGKLRDDSMRFSDISISEIIPPTAVLTANTDGTVSVSGIVVIGTTVTVQFPDNTIVSAEAGAGGAYGPITSGVLLSSGNVITTYVLNGNTSPEAIGQFTALPVVSDQTFCISGTVANLTATGNLVKWYAVASGGSVLATSTALASGTYYVTQTVNGLESARKSVLVTINNTNAPVASAQSLCGSATVANLQATGTALKWYTVLTGGTVLLTDSSLTAGTYFVSQTLNSCESSRTSVAVTLTTTAAPTASAQVICNSGTVANLTATGTDLKWYTASTGGSALATSTALTARTYYVSQTLNSCESSRVSSAVTIPVCVLSKQVIAEQPYHDGGFEGQSGVLGTTTQSAINNIWRSSTASNVPTVVGVFNTSAPRSGNTYLTQTLNATTPATNQSGYSRSTFGASATTNVAKWVTFYYKPTPGVTQTSNNLQIKGGYIYTDGAAATTQVYGATVLVPTSTSYTKYSKAVAAPINLGTSNTQLALYLKSVAGGVVSVDVDDIVVYDGTAEDIIAPNAPASANIVNVTASGLVLNWTQPAVITSPTTEASSGVDGGGYVVVRYSSNPNADNDPNVNGIYALGNTITNGTGSLVGTVVYIGTGTTFTDSSLASSTSYYYKVYAVDKAFNYSTEIQVTGVTTGPLASPVASAATTLTADGFTANWSAVANATSYDLYVYNTNTQSNIVAWTFPTTWVAATGYAPIADIANSNNTSSTITQSSGTVTAGEGSGGVGTYSISAASWYNNPNKYWEAQVNTTGYRNIKLSSKLYSTAPKDFKLQYKIGVGGTYIDVDNGAFVCSNNWTTGLLSNLALPAACDNVSSVYLRWINYTNIDYNTGLAMTGGTARLDDIYVTGGALVSESLYPVTISGTSSAVSGLSVGTYYYDVIASGSGYTSSVKSNLITALVSIPQSVADFKSVGTASTSSATNWEFYNGTTWGAATVAPTSTNNVTVSSSNVVSLGANFTVDSGKTLMVTGTINLAGYVVSGAGTFTLSSGASMKLGNNTSIASAITTTNKTFDLAANYFYDGTVAQTTASLPTATMTGNVTVSNAAGVTMAAALKINTPGTLEVTATGKLLFGDGDVVSATIGSGTFTYSGTGGFTAATGATLSITSSKGISGTSNGSIKNSGTRTFNPGVNYIFAKNDLANAITMGTSFGTEISATLGINNLTINNPLGVYLPGVISLTAGEYNPDVDITVNGVLNFVSGKLIANNGISSIPQITGTKIVIIGASGSISGAASGTGWVIGNLKKATASAASPSFTYTIGDATNYLPLALTFIGNTTATGGLTARVNTGDHASIAGAGIDASKSVNRTWTLTNDALAGFGSYNAAFAYANADNDAGTTAANYVVRKFENSTWSSLTTSGTTTDTAATATGITSFGDFAIGEAVPCTPTTTGSESVSACGSSYVWATSGATYNTSGTYTHVVGCNTATLTLTLSPATTTGSATVLACGSSYTWALNSQTYNSPGTFTHIVGCNTATLNLTITAPTTIGSVTQVQTGGSYLWAANGQTYTTSGTRTYVVDCNTATLNLTINSAESVIPTSPLNLCKGATVASVTGTTSLKFYKDNVTTTQLVSTTKFVTAVTYYVTETNSGNESSRVPVTITVNNLPATPSGLTSTESGLICKYINSSSPVTFTATAAGTISSYIWTVPTGASFTSGATAVEANPTTGTGTIDSIGLSFEEVSATPGPIGSVTVKIVDANGCISLPKALALATKLPTAPTSLVMTSADNTLHFKGLVSAADATTVPPTPAVYGLFGLNTLTAGIKKVGPYMDTATVFILTAPAAVTAASYLWTLPSGVNAIASGTVAISSLGVVTSTTPVITANFADVTPGTTALPIVVQSVGGCGNSTNRTLSLARTVPGAPTALVLTSEDETPRIKGAAVFPATTPVTYETVGLDSLLKITKVGPYTGTDIAFTLTATPFTTQGATATSYAWILPAGVTCETAYTEKTVYQNANVGSVEVPNIVYSPFTAIETPTNVITVKFGNATKGIGNLDLLVFGVNGAGNSLARKLTLSRALPTAPTALVLKDASTVVTKAGVYAGKETPLTLTATPFLVQGAEATSYSWVLPAGVNVTAGATNLTTPVTDGSGNKTWTSTGTVLTVDLEGITTATTVPMNVYAVNGAGTSLPKALTSVATALPLPVAAVAGSLSVCNSNLGYDYTITAPVGANKYLIVAPEGSVVTSASSPLNSTKTLTTTDLIFKVVYSGTTAFLSTDKKLNITAGNVIGFLPTAKAFTLTKLATCPLGRESADEFKVSAYPNPSSSEFTIQASRKGATVKVYDMMGRLIENRQATSNTVQVGSRFAAGAYNVIVKQGANTKTLKVIKK